MTQEEFTEKIKVLRFELEHLKQHAEMSLALLNSLEADFAHELGQIRGKE